MLSWTPRCPPASGKPPPSLGDCVLPLPLVFWQDGRLLFGPASTLHLWTTRVLEAALPGGGLSCLRFAWGLAFP